VTETFESAAMKDLPASGEQATEIRTFMFADVRGYTRFTQEHGDEVAARLATKFAALARDTVAARGGDVIELRGDEALAVFASSRQALRAAIELQERFRRESIDDPTLPLKVGIGLDAGEAVRVEGGYRGGALNLAARLCSLAGPGEVLTSEGVIHLARKMEGIAYGERGFAQLKGFAHPVRIVEVTGETAAPAAAPEPDTSEQPAEVRLPIGGFLGALPSTLIVARDQELQRTLSIVDAVAGGSGQLVMLAGEPGVGKTRLAQEVTLNVRNRAFLVATGRCYEPQQTVPFYPFLEALTAAYENCPPALRAEIPHRWPHLARILPDVKIPGTETGSDGQDDPLRLFRSVAGFLEAISEQTPVALLLDDLHWADGASLDLLQYLARNTRGNRVLILGTYRDVEINRRHPLEAVLRDLMREDLVERITIRRLGQDGTAQLMAVTFDEADISQEFASLVYQRTEGNPFFVQHVLRVLVERGDVFRENDRWERRAVGEMDVPESVRSVIGQRLSRLSDDTQEILAEASVLGQTFAFDDLATMSGRSEDEVEQALTEAETLGLVREIGHDRYAFDHALTQQSLYAELPGRRRRKLHRATGEALEQLPGKERDRRAPELAWHFLQADDEEQALPYAMQAGDQARTIFAYGEALQHYATVLEIAEQLGNHQRAAEALSRLAKLRLDTFRGKEAVADYQRLLRIAKEHGDRAQELEALLGLGGAYYVSGLDDTEADFLSRSRESYEAAYALARETGDKRGMVRALVRTAWFDDFWPDYTSRAEANIREAFALSQEIGDEDLLIDSKLVMWHRQPRDEAQVMGEALWSQLEARRDFHRLNELLFGLMWTYQAWGEFERSIDACDAGFRVAGEIGVLPVQYATLRAIALSKLGRYGEAWEWLQKEVADDDHPFGRAMQEFGIAGYYLELMAYEQAEQAYRRLIEQGGRLNRAWMVQSGRLGLARSLIRSGRSEEEEIPGIARELGAAGAEMSTPIAAERALARGDLDDALREAASSAADLLAKEYKPDYVSTLELKVRVLLAMSRPEEALTAADEALPLAEEIRYRRLIWQLQAGKAHALAALGNANKARESYSAAATIIGELSDTIPDPPLKQQYLSNPLVVSVLSALQDPVGRPSSGGRPNTDVGRSSVVGSAPEQANEPKPGET
jgi:class 3 adenylate cyclase/tetratricopeptide (TPR) repeat protein